MNYLISFLFTFLLAVLLTGIVKKIGTHYGIVSKPRPRDVHKTPIPRIGGIAIFISFLLVALGYILFSNRNGLNFGLEHWFGMERHLFAILVGGFVITVSMLFDDIKGLRPWQKLSVQILAALITIAAGIGINSLPNPFGEAINLNSVYIPILSIHNITYHFSLWSDLLTLIWIVGLMNIINFVDGIDGLAGGVSVISFFTIFLLSITLAVNQPATAAVAIMMTGATLGFLVWNFPPAKIFMGDSGSMFLGFMLGILTLISGGKLATVFLVLGFPIIDGLIVVGGRLRRGENPLTTPDKTHLHHRFLKAGFTPRSAILSMYAISVAFAWVALRSNTNSKMIAAVLLVALVFLLTRVLNYMFKLKSEKPSRHSVSS